MTVLHETVDVSRPVNEAFAYVSDFTTTAEWDPTVLHASQSTPGAIAVGTEFKVVCALPVGSIDLQYRVVELTANKRIVLHGRSRFFNVHDTISFAPSARGTKIDYRAEFFFTPFVRALGSPSRSALQKMGRESVAGLAEALADDFPLALKNKHRAEKLLPELSLFTRLGYRLAAKRYHPMSASVAGSHMLITGASSGLGYVTARELARRGAELTLIMRDGQKAQRTVAALERETGSSKIRWELADLSLMSEVEALVERLNKRGQAIDVLINNAGALFNTKEETAEGLERSFALLLLSPYRLTEGLKPLLRKAAAPRVINVVSGGMYSQKLQVDLLTDETRERYSGSIAYARQKRALMVLTQQWAKDWAAEGIAVNAMHPGWADTPGVQRALPAFRRCTRRVLRSADEGADTIVWLAVATEAGRASGKLFLDREAKSTHLLKKTRESAAERRKLLAFLSHFPDLSA
ncbi:MAG: SDR family NAD(P)-dependent oxidoreductase [Halioglobus sp.]|nr:SDR family NAD(P)-dependent oxidoreductase [Halioglobus sp.]